MKFYVQVYILLQVTQKKFGTSVGSAGKGLCTITGNVREYVDDENEASIKNVKIELLDKDGKEVQLYDNSDKAIDAIYSDEKGNYQINGIDTASIEIGESGEYITKSKEYTVQFTYGTEEQLRVNPKYNGQDYQAKKGGKPIEAISEKKETSEQIEEIKKKDQEIETEYYEEGKKIDVYFILDCSGSMQTVVEQTKQGLKLLADKVFEKFGDDAKIGLIAYGDYNCFDSNNRVKNEIPLSTKDEYESKVDAALARVKASGNNYNQEAIDLARESIKREGREDSEKYIILIGDGLAYGVTGEEFRQTKEAYEKAKNEEIKLFSLLVGSPWAIKTHWSEIMFSLAGTDWYYSEEENTASVLEFITYQYLLGNREFINNIEYVTESGTKEGNIGREIKLSRGKESVAADDEERRKAVNKYTNIIDNNNGTKIREVFENKNMEEVKEVAENTYMTAKIKIKISGYITRITNVNLVLEERPKNEVSISTEISKIDLVLANGSKLVEHTPENKNKYVFDLGKGSQKMITMDNELKQGATLNVTYRTTIANVGNIDNVTYTLVNYIDPLYSFEEGSMNKDWHTSNAPKEVTTTLTLAKGEKKTIDLTLKRIVTTGASDEYNNTVEIKAYKSDEGRRIYQTTPYNKEENEKDIAIADMLSIVPPTGL